MILVDTGPLVAAINLRDPARQVCRTLASANVIDAVAADPVRRAGRGRR